MRGSIFIGKRLPENQADYATLEAEGGLAFTACLQCGQSFLGRTTSPEGWRDTQIVGWCEVCYDTLMGACDADE